MKEAFRPFEPGHVKLLANMFQHRLDSNRRYLMSFDNEKLLQNYHLAVASPRASGC